MDRAGIFELIVRGVERGESAWADLGSGDGAFTSALRELLGPDAEIYAVDRDEPRLWFQQHMLEVHGENRNGTTRFINADFTGPLELPPLDGLLMANSLHYVEDQVALLARLRGHLKPAGKLLIVEYELKRVNPWVPYPVPYDRLVPRVVEAGFTSPARIATAPTRFGGHMYAALAHRLPVSSGVGTASPTSAARSSS